MSRFSWAGFRHKFRDVLRRRPKKNELPISGQVDTRKVDVIIRETQEKLLANGFTGERKLTKQA